MMGNDALLPVLHQPGAHAGCSRSGYVTAAELKIWSALRRLGEEARAVRRAGLVAAARGDAAAAAEAFARLDDLRRRRQPLAAAREEAWRRKMITLGHLAADDEHPVYLDKTSPGQ